MREIDEKKQETEGGEETIKRVEKKKTGLEDKEQEGFFYFSYEEEKEKEK